MPAPRFCRSCGQQIQYATTPANKSQALDLKATKDGTTAIVNGVAVFIPEDRRANYEGPLYMPHAARHGKAAPKQTGLVSITGLAPLDEADRLARALLTYAGKLVKREADFNDCRAAWRYFLAANPGIARDIQGLVAPRVREIIAQRAGSEARA